MRGTLPKLGVALLALVLLTSAAAAAASVNFSAQGAQNPQLNADVTKDYHEVGWAATDYEDDNGETESLPAAVNDSVANPVELTATDIEADSFGEFPRKSDESENSASALDASEWSTSTSDSGGDIDVSDQTTAPSVDAVGIDVTDQTDDDVATATYDNVSITSDVEKRYVQLAGDVDTLDSDADVTLRLNDPDGDYVDVTVANSSADASDETVMANSTGEGAVLQTQIGSVPVEGSGDGTLDEIEDLEVRTSDGDADVDFSLINAEKMGEYQFGEQAYDEDDDGEKDETRTITDPTGPVEIKGVDTMGDTFDDAAIHGGTWAMTFAAEHVESDSDVNVTYSDAESYPSFDVIADQYYRLELPTAYDLSYSNAELTDTVEMPSERYKTVEYAEGTGDTEFDDISSWDGLTDQYSTQDANVTIDETIEPGQTYAYHAQLALTEDEQSDMEAGGAAGQVQDEPGGILDTIFSLPGMIVGGIAGFLGLRRWRG